MNKYKDLEDILKYKFEKKELLLEALTHKSFKKTKNNERLEFLGDAVLNLVIGEHLFKQFPDLNEGDLSKIRANLVSERGFEKLANVIKIGNYIFLSNSEEYNKGRFKASILSDAFEAIMGAIYLESGLEKVKEITLRLLEIQYNNIDLKNLFSDYKTALQEITQGRFGTIPIYKIEDEIGPDHAKEFELSIWIDEKHYGTAKGKSKKLAQQACAKIAFEKLQNKEEI